MLDPILSKSQSYVVSHRCVLKNSCCEVFEKISEKKTLVKMSFLKNIRFAAPLLLNLK